MKKVFAALICCAILGSCSTYDTSYRYYSKRAKDVPQTVTVKSGDTVYDISRYYNVSMQEIIQLNGLSAPYMLQIGQKLRMPAPRIYTVAKGDTLYEISRDFGVDMRELAQTNNLQPPYRILVGQDLYLPYSSQSTQVQVAQVTPASKPGGTVSASTSTGTVQPATRKPVTPVKVAQTPPPKSSGRFSWPLRGDIVSNFGPKAGGEHNDGINIIAPEGTSVAAVDNGVVAYAGNELRGYGNLVLVRHDGGWITAYAHLDQITVAKGQTITQGMKVGTVGRSGGVSPAQLHFELRKGSKAVDPKGYLGA